MTTINRVGSLRPYPHASEELFRDELVMTYLQSAIPDEMPFLEEYTRSSYSRTGLEATLMRFDRPLLEDYRRGQLMAQDSVFQAALAYVREELKEAFSVTGLIKDFIT
jgi:hypothetical protein